ncbi:DAO-domain-containing protein [Coniophora puteana RWD-64-598 SS2]|uniref:DAO-domain-containing protein n=1 Tax=Coniophora puteana (strain RWD-64-598) TaxID=741705 RepID=A0A5M3MKS3_CONPW|nr:DAO-domain-containing protein [Coniophora puteana RWD-64-598 SS2]EIW79683.1 DAO-domain-containing protein [Coniophora puteana RWD-64-598 SS2]
MRLALGPLRTARALHSPLSGTMTNERNIVIIGGGIIGCTTAYYLTRHPSFSPSSTKITVLEASRNGVAQGASGKAGGLVASWAFPRELVDISFAEHVKLAEENGGAARWGWRYTNCGSWEGRGAADGEGIAKSGENGGRASTGLPDDLDWVGGDLTTAYSPIAGHKASAQVHPYLFTSGMMDLAKEKGAELIKGKAVNINKDGGRVTGVTYQESDEAQTKTIPATHVVLAAGPWTPSLEPSVPISTTFGCSITIRPKPSVTISPYVLFTEIQLPESDSFGKARVVSPEIYTRPDNEVYASGHGSVPLLPDNIDDVPVSDEDCNRIFSYVASISQELREGTIERRQGCFRPVVSTGGGPIIGEAGKIAKGLYIATGHTCWGICNAPGTAKALAELIFEGKIKCGRLDKLAPNETGKMAEQIRRLSRCWSVDVQVHEARTGVNRRLEHVLQSPYFPHNMKSLLEQTSHHAAICAILLNDCSANQYLAMNGSSGMAEVEVG